MHSRIKGKTYQGWRILIYGVFFVGFLHTYFEKTTIPQISKTEKNSVESPSKVRIQRHEKIKESQRPKLNDSHYQTKSTVEATASNQKNDLIETTSSSDSIEDDPRSYGNLEIEDESVIENEVSNLLTEAETIYGENRTLTVSEVAKLHNVKNDEVLPFAVTNEAQLLLRELAIENRIPERCAEDLSDDCLIILERSQAGSVPFECQESGNNRECKRAFARFWKF